MIKVEPLLNKLKRKLPDWTPVKLPLSSKLKLSIPMTNSNGNSDRLDRIEAIVESNSRAIQAMMEQRATDRLEHEARMNRLEDLVTRLTRIEEAQNSNVSWN